MPPEDTGGHDILEYSIEAAQFIWNGTHYAPSNDNFYVAVERTGSAENYTVLQLENFIPYHFKVCNGRMHRAGRL